MNHTNKQSITINRITRRIGYSRGKLFGILIVGALLAFELFNYSTTDYALNDLLGGLRFISIRWATILAIAFCGIDFAGIARLFTPHQASNDTKEVWYLFGAWLLAASMNAMLTWWGVALAIVNHESLGGTVIDRDILIKVVPIFVAIMVWLIRVLIIGTFSVAGDRLFSQANPSSTRETPVMVHKVHNVQSPQPKPMSFRSIQKSPTQTTPRPTNRPDPTYHPTSMTGYKITNNQTRQKK